MSPFLNKNMRYFMVSKKKNPLFMRGWDRKIRPSWFTVCHHSASLVIPNGDPQGEIFYSTLILMIDSYSIYIYIYTHMYNSPARPNNVSAFFAFTRLSEKDVWMLTNTQNTTSDRPPNAQYRKYRSMAIVWSLLCLYCDTTC